MKFNELYSILSNKILSLNNQKQIAVSQGDLDLVVGLEAEINETQATVDKLAKLL